MEAKNCKLIGHLDIPGGGQVAVQHPPGVAAILGAVESADVDVGVAALRVVHRGDDAHDIPAPADAGRAPGSVGRHHRLARRRGGLRSSGGGLSGSGGLGEGACNQPRQQGCGNGEGGGAHIGFPNGH